MNDQGRGISDPINVQDNTPAVLMIKPRRMDLIIIGVFCQAFLILLLGDFISISNYLNIEQYSILKR